LIDSVEGWFEFVITAQFYLQQIKVQANERWKDKASNVFKSLFIPLTYTLPTILHQCFSDRAS